MNNKVNFIYLRLFYLINHGLLCYPRYDKAIFVEDHTLLLKREHPPTNVFLSIFLNHPNKEVTKKLKLITFKVKV